jgi:hypothetical protein
MIRNMVINLSKGDRFGASSQVQSENSNCKRLKEEETVHQLEEDMEIVKQDSVHVNAMMEEVANYHALY